MAGAKGRSGGARPGAGRKPKPAVFLPQVAPKSALDEPDSIKLLRQITNDASLDAKIRLEAAKALAPYEMMRKGDAGIKETRKEAAKKVAQGKFAPAVAPRLVVSNK